MCQDMEIYINELINIIMCFLVIKSLDINHLFLKLLMLCVVRYLIEKCDAISSNVADS